MEKNRHTISSLLPQDALSRKIMTDRAASLAQVSQDDGDIQKEAIHYIKFMLGDDEYYGIPYEDILDVKPCELITRVPFVPPYVLGISYWHGKLMAIIDLARYFGIRRDESDMNKPFIATVPYQQSVIGFAFDQVIGVDAFHHDELKNYSHTNPKISKSSVRGIHHGNTMILTIQPILADISRELTK